VGLKRIHHLKNNKKPGRADVLTHFMTAKTFDVSGQTVGWKNEVPVEIS
jgi:hypothetical protein